MKNCQFLFIGNCLLLCSEYQKPSEDDIITFLPFSALHPRDHRMTNSRAHTSLQSVHLLMHIAIIQFHIHTYFLLFWVIIVAKLLMKTFISESERSYFPTTPHKKIKTTVYCHVFLKIKILILNDILLTFHK